MKTIRLLAFLHLALLALLHPVLALAQQSPQPAPQNYPYWHGPGHMWGRGDGGGFWWGGPLMMLGFVVIVCIVIFLLVRRPGGDWHHHHRGPWHMRGGSPGPDPSFGDPTYSALQILNERFARGEIQKQEYEEKKAAILATGPR